MKARPPPLRPREVGLDFGGRRRAGRRPPNYDLGRIALGDVRDPDVLAPAAGLLEEAIQELAGTADEPPSLPLLLPPPPAVPVPPPPAPAPRRRSSAVLRAIPRRRRSRSPRARSVTPLL